MIEQYRHCEKRSEGIVRRGDEAIPGMAGDYFLQNGWRLLPERLEIASASPRNDTHEAMMCTKPKQGRKIFYV
jgi:hypothetical protein